MADYLEWFVDREKQYGGFQKMLAGETSKRMMIIEAPSDMGKTWTLQRMRSHAEEDGIPTMYIDFRDRRPHDYLSMVRSARDQFGGDHFNKLTETINNFTGVNITIGGSNGGGDVNVSDVDSSEINTGDIAAGDIIKDNQFYIQADSEMARRAAEIQINDAFVSCLSELVGEKPAVFFFDSFEEVTEEAERWLLDYLFLWLREKQLGKAIIIVAGRKSPQMAQDLKQIVAKTGLDLFDEEAVREYVISRRGITDLDLDTILKTSGGYPGLLAKMADVAAMEADDDDDWL